MVNPEIKRVLYGAQTQANKVNDAVAQFVDDYLTEHNYKTYALFDEDNIAPFPLQEIRSALRDLVNMVKEGKTLSLEDSTFARIFLGNNFENQAKSVVDVGYTCVSNSGKYAFFLMYVASENNTEVMEQNVPQDIQKTVLHERSTKLSEDDAMQLAAKILKDCPNRQDYPEDDILAAILYGEKYWKGAN